MNPLASNAFETGYQHTLALLGFILLVFSVIVAYLKIRDAHRATLKAREEAAIERQRQSEILQKINKEFHPNGGSSLIDKITDIGDSLSAHIAAADEYWATNTKDHEDIKKCHEENYKEINRRVDGMYEIMLGGNASAPRKMSQRHTALREGEQHDE